MAKQKMLEVIKQKIWGKDKPIRDLTRFRVNEKGEEIKVLDERGFEVPDPVPYAIAMGITPTQSIDDRIREIMRRSYVKANPDLGLDSEDPDDFGPEDGDTTEPMYEFEKRHAHIQALEDELSAASKELQEAKALYSEKRKKGAPGASKAPPKDVTPEVVIDPDPEDGGPND